MTLEQIKQLAEERGWTISELDQSGGVTYNKKGHSLDFSDGAGYIGKYGLEVLKDWELEAMFRR